MGLKGLLRGILGGILSRLAYKRLTGANRPLKRLLKSCGSSHAMLNIGAGATQYADGIVNVDIYPGRNVSVVAPAEALPFADGSFDLVICQDVLEHIDDLDRVRSEIMRVLRDKGRLFVQIPFVFPFHYSPDDHYRFTVNGAQFFFRDLRLVEKGVSCGPTVALANSLAAWISIVLSFNLEPLRKALWLLGRLVLTPLVLLDWVVARLPFAHFLASEVYFIGEK